MVLSAGVETCRIVKYIEQVMNIALFKNNFCSYPREVINVFPDLTKALSLAFHRHCSNKIFQSLHYSNLAWSAPMHTRLMTLTLFQSSSVSVFLDSCPL